MSTIDQLMTGKKPGEIKIRASGWDDETYFVPYFQEDNAGNYWYGVIPGKGVHNYNPEEDGWEIYSEPKPKVKRWMWIIKYEPTDELVYKGLLHVISTVYMSEEETKRLDVKLIKIPQSEMEFDD